ncbi:hypothetical protein ACSDR0_27585 [Streptosporangium sp. G11]|uniref:hypothetical protein n=1 Tax=Streptosporangium sp. G11 TaxID=3436926 RepID=UPI003EBF438E
MDELTSVRDLLTEPEPSREVIAAGRARLLAAVDPFTESPEPSGLPSPRPPGGRMIRQARRGRRTAWWTALGVGLAGTAAAAALVIASPTAVRPPTPLTKLPGPDTSATARQVLLAAATAVPASTPTPQGENKVYGRNRLVIDVASGLPLSRERDGLDRLPDGRTYKVTSFTAYERIGWTDDLPDLPARRD